ncbi:MAG: thiamine-binding protein [Cellulosilyticaceae bacterium]
MANASVAIQVLPKVEGQKLIEVVDKVIEYIQSTGLKNFVGPFETVIEGDYEELMELIKQCQLICIREGAPSVMAYVKINYNPTESVLSIEKKVGKYHENGN